MISSSPELIDAMLSLMPDAAVLVDHDGMIMSANGAMGEMFGYEPGELIGQRLEVLVPERFRSLHRGHRGTYNESPHPRSMGAGVELFGRRFDGTEFPVDISLAPQTLPGGVVVVAAIRDATERREAEAAHAQLAAIVESSSDAIFATTIDGFVESWNAGAENILGHPVDEIVGSHLSVMLPENASLDLEDQMHAALQGRPLGSRCAEWRARDDRLLPVEVSVSPLRSALGEVTGFSVVLRDITERRRIEEQIRELAADGERHARWYAVMAELRLQLLGGAELAPMFTLLCDRVCELLDAKSAVIAIGHPAVIVAAVGSAGGLSGELDPIDLPTAGEGARLIELTEPDQPRFGLFDSPFLLVVSITRSSEMVGYLQCGLSERPDDTAMMIAVSLADHVGLGIELDQARADREHLLLSDDRERIARDLHDLVIQRLFASGLSLQSALPLVSDERALGRLGKVVDELDETIREIRTTIFTLAPSPLASTGLRVALIGVAGDASRVLGFEPTLRFDGPVDSVVGVDVLPHVLAVVHESLSNVARHAQASKAAVEVVTDGVEVSVVVQDDGIGIGEVARESGLRNLRRRAEDLGGTFAIGPREGGGTRLEWRVPVKSTG